MVKLIDTDIMTREVLDWEGIHLFHFHGSSCSQKTRICFNLSNIDYIPHVVDLFNGENYTEYYLGINPRGLVPTLVYNGEVHIESNDIILFIDENIAEVKYGPVSEKTLFKAQSKEGKSNEKVVGIGIYAKSGASEVRPSTPCIILKGGMG